MLSVPSYSPLGTVLSAVIVVLCAAGLTMHADFYAGTRRRDYWAYYTNVSNLLVFLYFALAGPLLYATRSLRALIPHAEYALTLCILLTHLVFHHCLAPFLSAHTPYLPLSPDRPLERADSAVQHYAVPLTTLAYWLLCSPGKWLLDAGDAVYWLAVPAAYAALVLVRAPLRGCIHRTQSAYPYPFLDVARFGARRVLRLCALLLALCAGAGLCGVLAVRAAFSLLSCLP